MKKIKKCLALLIFSLYQNATVMAADKPKECSTVFCWWWDWLKPVKDNLPDNIIWSERLSEVVMWFLAYFLPFAWLFAFMALVYAWFLYVTSATNDKNAETAKDIVIYVAIWILLIFLSYSIVAVFINIG